MGTPLSYAAAAAGGSLEDQLKQMFLEQLKKQELAQEAQRIKIAQQSADDNSAYRRMSQESANESRAVQNAGRIAGALKIGQTVAPETAASLQAGDLGDLVQHETADLPSRAISGSAQAGAKAPSMGPLRIMQAGRPERDTFTGTAEQAATEQARQDALAARTQAAADRIAAREDAQKAAMEMQRQRAADAENQARIVAGLRGGNSDLQRQILQDKIDAAEAKKTEKQQSVDTARNAALASIDDTAGALDELIDANGQLKPGVAGAFGWDALRSRIPGTSAADAKARLDRLQSRLTVDLLGEMKRQSRTGASGFGALSEKELAVLQNAAARLGTSQSDESARQALLDVRKQLAGMRQRATGAVPAASPAGGSAAPKRIRYDMNGNPIKD